MLFVGVFGYYKESGLGRGGRRKREYPALIIEIAFIYNTLESLRNNIPFLLKNVRTQAKFFNAYKTRELDWLVVFKNSVKMHNIVLLNNNRHQEMG